MQFCLGQWLIIIMYMRRLFSYLVVLKNQEIQSIWRVAAIYFLNRENLCVFCVTDWLVCDDFDKHFLSSSGRFARKKLANIGRTRQSNLEHFVTRVMFWVQNSGYGDLMNKEYWFWNEVKLKVQIMILWIFLLLEGLKPSLLKFENWVKTHRLSTSADFLLKTSMRKFFQWFHTIVIRHSCNMRKQISLGHLEIFGQFLYLHYHLAQLKSSLHL